MAVSHSDALELLKEGNHRFLDKSVTSRSFDKQIDLTPMGQYPFAAIVSCIYSRILTEIIFDQGIVDVFNACVVGNFVNEDIIGSLEFCLTEFLRSMLNSTNCTRINSNFRSKFSLSPRALFPFGFYEMCLTVQLALQSLCTTCLYMASRAEKKRLFTV